MCQKQAHGTSAPVQLQFLTTSMQLRSVLTYGSLQSSHTAARYPISWDYGKWAPFVTSNADHEGLNHNVAQENSRGWSQHVTQGVAGMKKYIRNHCQGVGTEFKSERLTTSRQWQLQSVRAVICSTPPIRISFAVPYVRYPSPFSGHLRNLKSRKQMSVSDVTARRLTQTFCFHSSSPGKTSRQAVP